MSMQNIQVSVNGGITWVYATDVRVIASDPDVTNEVHVSITNTGIKTDVVCRREIVGTQTKHHFDIIAELE